MPNPPVPAELKRRTGNPSHRPLPDPDKVLAVEGGYVEPLRPLGQAGVRLWNDVFTRGKLWISSRTDTQLLQMVCEQIDRRETLRSQLKERPDERSLHMSLNDIEKLIASNLSLLGFTPTDRSRLGVAEVKATSKIHELIKQKEALHSRSTPMSAGSSNLYEETT